MKFNDIKAENDHVLYSAEYHNAYNETVNSGTYLFGKHNAVLQDAFSHVSGCRYNVPVKNATDGLILALRAIYSDQTIIVPNFTAYPTAVAAKNVSPKIYYADVDETFCLNPDTLPNIKNSIIIPVHLFGNHCNMDALRDYAAVTDSIIIEDLAQATYPVTAYMGVYSFYPTKPIGSIGDGGIISTPITSLYEKLTMLAFYGGNKNDIFYLGLNSRMDELQCAFVNEKLKHFQSFQQKRIAIGKRYDAILGRNIYSQYTLYAVMFRYRDRIIKDLTKANIPYMIHYHNHVSEISALSGIYNKVNFRVNNNIISLPCHSQMTEDEIQKVEEFLYGHKDGYITKS